MKITTIISTFLVLVATSNGWSQITKISPEEGLAGFEGSVATKSSPINTPLSKSIDNAHTDKKWAISVKPVFSREHSTEEIALIKASKTVEKLNSYVGAEETQKSIQTVTPTIGTNFEGNWMVNGTPSDNTMAVSNGGIIVSANNDGIEYYNTSGTFMYFDFWADFFNDNGLTSNIYDPKVIYDSGSDRFVLIVLHGSTASTSKVLVCFSKTNNPTGGWWTYYLTGNPLGDNSWFDYPSIGVSTNEIYVSGNLFGSGGGPFNEAVIYQIPKVAGYTGASLNWQYWSGINSSPFTAFTIVPVSNGQQGNYGPGIYLVSNQSGGNNKIRMYDLTDDMSGNPVLNSYSVNTTSYSPSPDAAQSGNGDLLDNGDCRIQNGFYLNGIIHFVFHSDIGSGWNGINYNRLTTSNTTNQSSTFGLSGSFDYSFPSVASFASTASDKSVMIGFLRSSSAIYPEVRVVNCDDNMQWSSSTLVKSGETFVNILSGDERWGDYSGISRKHNNGTPKIWLSGCYGANIQSWGVNNSWKTWIAEVYGTASSSIEENNLIENVNIFPNPTYDFINIEFETSNYDEITIELLDQNGSMVRLMYKDTPKKGLNKLNFNKGALSAGKYFVVIKTTSKILRNEEIIIVN